MKKINPASVPMMTGNGLLAFCLHLAGVPWHDEKHPCSNIYTPESLFKVGGGQKDDEGNITRKSRYAGMSFDDAAKQACADGEKGNVLYVFQPAKNLKKLCKAFFDQEAQFKAAGNKIDVSIFALGIMKDVVEGRMSIEEGIVRTNCVSMKIRRPFAEQWMSQVPQIKRDKPGSASTRETAHGKVTQLPPFGLRAVNASQKIRGKVEF